MINKSWDDFLNEQFSQDYFKKLSAFLKQQYNEKTIYPPKIEVFSSFYFTDLDKVKVVILGQDPYHQENQACGLAFAVKPNVALPPSLVNIYKEIEDDLHIKMSDNGYLVKWATQGVMLLNAILTVEQSKANSHRGKGWEIFTDNVISYLNKQNQPIVFLLWGIMPKRKLNCWIIPDIWY
jgi:uracil-DNA glycosylase